MFTLWSPGTERNLDTVFVYGSHIYQTNSFSLAGLILNSTKVCLRSLNTDFYLKNTNIDLN